MKKLIAFLIILTGFCIRAGAQDIITLKDGTEIEARVLEVNLYDVRYKKFSNPDGPIYTEAKRNILMIRYVNGELDMFSKQTPTESSARPVPEGIAAGMQFREYVNLYSLRQYSRMEPEYYSPFAAGACSYILPGLGQIVSGETIRGLCIGAAAFGCMACATGFSDLSPAAGTFFGFAAVGMWIWNIYDAQRVAKIKNMYLNDSQKRGKVSVSAGPMSLKINF